jgi:hypothetical protein
VATVSKETLLASSKQHIGDVYQAMGLFAQRIHWAAMTHDHTKITYIDEFHSDFKTKFEVQHWFDNHKRIERHHINYPEGVRDDVNLIDVLEHIADCVMAGMGRSGSVYPLELSNELLQKAFQNTIILLKNEVTVEE